MKIVLDVERAVELQLEHADPAVRRDPVDLGAQRPVPPARDVLDPFEEPAVGDAARELVLFEEPVLAAVLLAGAEGPGRRRDRDLELRDALDERADQRPLAGAGRAGNDEDLARLAHAARRPCGCRRPELTCG